MFFSAFSPWIHQGQLQVSLLRHPGEARLAAQPAAGRHAVHGHEAAACPPEAEVSAPFPRLALSLFPFCLCLVVPAWVRQFFFSFTRNHLTFFPSDKAHRKNDIFPATLPFHPSCYFPPLAALHLLSLPTAIKSSFWFSCQEQPPAGPPATTTAGTHDSIFLRVWKNWLMQFCFFLHGTLWIWKWRFCKVKIWTHWNTLWTLVVSFVSLWCSSAVWGVSRHHVNTVGEHRVRDVPSKLEQTLIYHFVHWCRKQK